MILPVSLWSVDLEAQENKEIESCHTSKRLSSCYNPIRWRNDCLLKVETIRFQICRTQNIADCLWDHRTLLWSLMIIQPGTRICGSKESSVSYRSVEQRKQEM